jgi:hypothetical protein
VGNLSSEWSQIIIYLDQWIFFLKIGCIHNQHTERVINLLMKLTSIGLPQCVTLFTSLSFCLLLFTFYLYISVSFGHGLSLSLSLTFPIPLHTHIKFQFLLLSLVLFTTPYVSWSLSCLPFLPLTIWTRFLWPN